MDAQAETWIEVSGGSYVLAPDQLACLRDALRGQVAAWAKASPARLVSEVVRYKDAYRLCYIRGPEGLLIGLAQELG